MTITVNHTWRTLLTDLLKHGTVVKPRGRTTYEWLGYIAQVDMTAPLVTTPARKLGYRYVPAEAAWVLSGDNRVGTIKPFSRRMPSFSDDGHTFFGAYGPKFVEQAGYVVDCLYNDPLSRQAVMTLWRERPRPTLDVPCTLSLQWLIRDGRLHCFTNMRSSDAWLGWPNDVFTFSMMSAYVCLLYRNRRPGHASSDGPQALHDPKLKLGNLRLYATSQHLYEIDRPLAERAIEDVGETFAYAPLDLDEFTSPDALTSHLWDVANARPHPLAQVQLGYRWLQELPQVIEMMNGEKTHAAE